MGKPHAFALVAVQDRRCRTGLQHVGQIPCEVDGIAQTGVHSLTPRGAVDIRGVADEEDASDAEVAGNTVMHVVRTSSHGRR